MAADNPKYDAAISFLTEDISLATALHDRLREGLDVFSSRATKRTLPAPTVWNRCGKNSDMSLA